MNIDMKWHPSTERPTNGNTVWIIERHPKMIRPLSYAIHAGVVETQKNNPNFWRVIQADETGHGSCFWIPEHLSTTSPCIETYVAWSYWYENPILPHWV